MINLFSILKATMPLMQEEKFLSNNSNSSQLEFTFSVQNLPYLKHLKFNVYKDLCTLTDPTPYPPESTGKEATQYWFSSLTSPALG
jgi:hypothetical protein